MPLGEDLLQLLTTGVGPKAKSTDGLPQRKWAVDPISLVANS